MTLGLSAALAGCAGQASTRAVVATNAPGVFVVTSTSTGSDAGILIAQSQALDQARAFCSDHSGEMRTLRGDPVYEAATGQARFTVAFRCDVRGDHTL